MKWTWFFLPQRPGRWITLVAAFIAVCSWSTQAASLANQAAARQLKIDLDKAVAVEVPAVQQDLVAKPFTLPDQHQAWVVRLPGKRPIATPAYADGRLFVGGGYGSHEFYALDAKTGKKVWEMHTSDDGPTAAVVEDGCVAFNTESCTVIVADAQTGKLLWEEWLGDPLMSQPAIAKGRLSWLIQPASVEEASKFKRRDNYPARLSRKPRHQLRRPAAIRPLKPATGSCART